MTLIMPGVCRYCRREIDGDKCCAVDSTATRCTSPGCVIAEERRRRIAQQQAVDFASIAREHPNWEPGAIRLEMAERRKRKRALRRKAKAA